MNKNNNKRTYKTTTVAKCQYCGKEVYLPYRCRYCGGLFCDDNRLPPKHNCSGIALWESKSPFAKLRRVRVVEKPGEKPEEVIPYIPDHILPSAEPDEPIPGWEEYSITREELDHLYQIPYRKYCYFCGKYIYDDLQFICSICGLSFCEEHKSPEAHICFCLLYTSPSPRDRG